MNIDKYGWLEINLDPNDSRIRVYKLKEPKAREECGFCKLRDN